MNIIKSIAFFACFIPFTTLAETGNVEDAYIMSSPSNLFEPELVFEPTKTVVYDDYNHKFITITTVTKCEGNVCIDWELLPEYEYVFTKIKASDVMSKFVND